VSPREGGTATAHGRGQVQGRLARTKATDQGERATATVVLKGRQAFLGGGRVVLPRRPGARVERVGDVRPLPSCCGALRTLRRGLAHTQSV
jgi:hypothetical protein